MTMASKELLSEFGFLPSSDFHVFGGDCIVMSHRIETGYRNSNYDHKPSLPQLDPSIPSSSAMMTEQYRVGYACFKREVARVLQPKSILEVGIGMGTSAMAFLDGCPTATYVGLDNNSGEDFLVKPSDYVSGLLSSGKFKNRIQIGNSQEMSEFPHCDLVHVDGDHSRQGVRHDVTLAWRSEAKWILCDDARDAGVVGGIFDAIHGYLRRGNVDWAYFPDTWTGNILIRTEHGRDT